MAVMTNAKFYFQSVEGKTRFLASRPLNRYFDKKVFFSKKNNVFFF